MCLRERSPARQSIDRAPIPYKIYYHISHRRTDCPPASMADDMEEVRAELLGFMPKLFDCVEEEIGMDALQKSMLNADLDYSCHFAGFATVERCLLSVHAEAQKRGLRNFKPRWNASCDIDRGCQKLLANLATAASPDTCVNRDILEVAGKPPGYAAALGRIVRLDNKIRFRA